MPDEPSTGPPTASPAPTTTAPNPEPPATATGGSAVAASAEQPGGAAMGDVDSLLERLGEQLWQHPKIAGRVGHLAQQLAARQTQQQQAETSRKAAEDYERQLMEEAERDPYAFTRKWLGEKASERAKREMDDKLAGLRQQTATEYLETLGRSLGQLPEWREASPQELQAFAEALAGKTEAELLGAFSHRAIDLVAEKRSARRVQQEIDREVEARLREREAKRVAEEASPDMATARTVPDVPDIRKMSDKDFDTFWQRNFKR